MPEFAREFTPELDEDLLRRLTSRITAQGQRRVGLAHGEALTRGLTGDPWEAARVGRAEQGTDELLSDVNSEFAFRKAGLQREERMIGEGREYESSERAKDREFQRSLLERRLQIQQDQDDDEFLQTLIGAGAGIAGSYFGGPAGGMLTKKLFG